MDHSWSQSERFDTMSKAPSGIPSAAPELLVVDLRSRTISCDGGKAVVIDARFSVMTIYGPGIKVQFVGSRASPSLDVKHQLVDPKSGGLWIELR